MPVTPDIVVTVCASAAGESCPAYLSPVLRTHWGVDDPSHVVGTEDKIGAALETAYAILRARIEAFLALPLDELKDDKAPEGGARSCRNPATGNGLKTTEGCKQ